MLIAPDAAGKSALDTFGNFARGRLHAHAGHAEIVWGGPRVAVFAGARRLVRAHAEDGVWSENAVPFGRSAPMAALHVAANGA